MIIKNLKIKILPLLKTAGVTKSEVFGSVARGEATKKSDLDLLVEMPENTSLFEFATLKTQLEDSLDMKVDLVSYDSLKKALKPFIQKDAIQIL